MKKITIALLMLALLAACGETRAAPQISETADSNSSDTVEFGGQEFFWEEEEYATGSLINLWVEKDGKRYPANISGIGGGLVKLDENNFTLMHSTLDAMFDPILELDLGRTEKPYWFFWNGESFSEHGGVPLAEDELRKLSGAAEVLDGIEGVIGVIFYRGASGLININYTVRQNEGDAVNNYYITLKTEAGKVTVLEQGDGHYLAALAPEIAVYPKQPITFA